MTGSRRPEELSVDHEAAIEKVAQGTLQGPWQIPAELVRLATASGAREVRVQIGERDVRVEAPEALLPRRTLSDLVTLLDRDVDAARRHEALAAVQEDEASALAAALCRPGTTLGLRLGGHGGISLSRDETGRITAPWVSEDRLGRPGLCLELGGLALERGIATSWLRRAARWCEARILLDGRRLETGFVGALIEGRLATAVGPARVALTRRTGPPRLWLLRHGILAATATVTDFPGFEAALELGGDAPATVPASGLREKAGHVLDPLLDAAIDLGLAAARRSDPPETLRRPVSLFLLEVAARRRRTAEISSTPFLRIADEGRIRPTTLDELARRIRVAVDGSCLLETLELDAPLDDLPRPTFLAETSERSLVAQVLGVQTVAPPTSSPGRSSWRRLRDLRDRLRAIRAREIPSYEWTEAESRLLEALSRSDPARDFGLRRGNGPPLLTSDRGLLAREAPGVVRATRALASRPSWVYPVWLALFGDREPSPPGLRETWRADAGPESSCDPDSRHDAAVRSNPGARHGVSGSERRAGRVPANPTGDPP